MLTKELGIVEYKNRKAIPDRLVRDKHAHYIGYAEQMLKLYREGVGKTRHELHEGVRQIFMEEPDCPTKRMDAFCKLLDEVSVFDTDKGRKSAALRQKVFRSVAPFHPLVTTKDRLFEHVEKDIKRKIAGELGMDWETIDQSLFSDVIEFNRLKSFSGYPDPRALLSRYNVAQVQVALYRATRLIVWAKEDFKTIVRYAKLARLLHQITFDPDSQTYCLRFDGPASVLRETQRYGVNMARFLPSLLACREWQMKASIRTSRGGWENSLEESSASGLKSPLTHPEEFDSSTEEGFAKKWGTEKREGWTMRREGRILHHRQKVFVPDFYFKHDNGREVFLEIVGFWTPEYLRDKTNTIREFQKECILLAVAERVGLGEMPAGIDIITYKTALPLKPVLESLRRALPTGTSLSVPVPSE